MVYRRDVLRALGLAAAAGSLPRLALATAGTDARFVLVVLRGALDGLALIPPYGDAHYRQQRGELALDPPGDAGGALDLDGFFGLHPSLPFLHSRYAAKEALVAHAVASPYRSRSHFDGQDLLENGGERIGVVRDGWLNRALGAGRHDAIAIAGNPPLVLRGAHPVASWAPSRLPDADEATIARLRALYADDEFFASRLEQALAAQAVATGLGDGAQRRRGNEARQFIGLMAAAAKFLVTPNGPRIAVLELGGWDTHANQGAADGALANRLAALDEGLERLHAGLGSAWQDTATIIVTEFGRTVRVNGTRGTDHGTATAALLLGGRVNGGRVVADWPGLADRDLHAGRDLEPTTDLRALFKGVLAEHLAMPAEFVEQSVFPDSARVRPLKNLLRA